MRALGRTRSSRQSPQQPATPAAATGGEAVEGKDKEEREDRQEGREEKEAERKGRSKKMGSSSRKRGGRSRSSCWQPAAEQQETQQSDRSGNCACARARTCQGPPLKTEPFQSHLAKATRQLSSQF